MTADEYREEFRQRLKMTRLRMDMTLDEVADELGVSREAVRQWEHGIAWPRAKMRRRVRRWMVEADEELERRQ